MGSAGVGTHPPHPGPLPPDRGERGTVRVGSFTADEIDALTAGWKLLPWRLIPERPLPPAVNVALDEVLLHYAIEFDEMDSACRESVARYVNRIPE